ncbi:MAG: ATP-binding protein [Chloroflexi bacterium]|nr:ATP-binding protein [Chloroflexota bacterium]
MGVVTSGSLSKGVEVKLDGRVSTEEMAVGRFVSIEGKKKRFFGLVTDVSLGAIDARMATNPPDMSDPFIAEVVLGSAAYGVLKVLPKLVWDVGTGQMQPAKTVPQPFQVVLEATQQDIDLIFGQEDEKRLVIGNPLDMEVKLCLNLEEFVSLSSGVFGRTGTGKTFFTHHLLNGLIQKSKAVNLVFDMHSEYGWSWRGQHGRQEYKALRQLFPSRVAVFALDEENARRRGLTPDFIVRIGYDQVEAPDIEILRDTLNMNELQVDAVHRVSHRLGKRWLSSFFEVGDRGEIAERSKEWGENEQNLGALYRRLDTLRRLPFLTPEVSEDAVDRIMHYLKSGVSVVLEFGRYRDYTSYILVANLLTRRIYDQYREQTEQARDDAGRPQPLVITLEEAHKFLSPELARQTIFGTIAREMRKYNVTLLVVDQRPSGIDPEVLSQLGTRIAFRLDNAEDIDAVLSGAEDRSELRTVLSRLETRQQALVFGHSVRMPVVVEVEAYGATDYYRRFGFLEPAEAKRQVDKDIEDLFK